MVAGYGHGSAFMSPPSGIIAVVKFRGGAATINIIPGRKDCAWDRVQQLGCELIVIVFAGGDVTGADQNEIVHYRGWSRT